MDTPAQEQRAPGAALPISKDAPLIAIAGNPNTGKTTLFNALTGKTAKVGNYPGITVDRYEGAARLPDGRIARILDVPGTYSLSARSEEERIALGAIAGLGQHERPDAIIVVLDATHLSRNLYLAMQIAELGLPVVLALTMVDTLEERGHAIDVETMELAMGLPTVAVKAGKRLGLDELLAKVGSVIDRERVAPTEWALPRNLADRIHPIEAHLPAAWDPVGPRRQAFALWALLSLDDDDEHQSIDPTLRACVNEVRAHAEADGVKLEQEIIAWRYRYIDQAEPNFNPARSAHIHVRTDGLDRVLLHPLFGFAIFLLTMTVLFQALFSWADPMIGWVEVAIGSFGGLVADVLPDGLFQDLLVDGLIGGVGAVLVFLPQILLLFFFIWIMEDTGYMSRVAFIMDRVMRLVGLHGRAFVPMLSGFACAVPAIMATRTMERRRDRLLTMMVVPLMTCSARLPVYTLLIAVMVPVGTGGTWTQGLLMAAMYIFSTVLALIVAGVLSKTVIRGPRVPLILEMPPYRRPHWPSVLRMLRQRSMMFVRDAGSVILVAAMVIWAMLEFPRTPDVGRDFAGERQAIEAQLTGGPSGQGAGDQASTDQAASDQLAAESTIGTPDIVTPPSESTIDMPMAALEEALTNLERERTAAQLENSYGGRLGRLIEPTIEPLGFDWKMGIGLVGAFAAREVFVGTMGVIYGIGGDVTEDSPMLRDKLRNEQYPDGRKKYTPLVCLSLLVFFALACQCSSTVAMVYRETASWRWPTFLVAYTFALAWIASFITYQGGLLLGFT